MLAPRAAGQCRRPDARQLPDDFAGFAACPWVPWLFVDNFIEPSLSRVDEMALTLLVGFTGFAAFTLGGITATLEHLDGDAAPADSRLHRVTPPPGERRAP